MAEGSKNNKSFFRKVGGAIINGAVTGAMSTVDGTLRRANEEGNKKLDTDIGNERLDSLDSIVNAGKSIMGSLAGAIPGTADDLRSGAAYDLQTVFDAIHANNFCDFDSKMGAFMDRLMTININEKNITLNVLGQDAPYNGDSTLLPAWVNRPSYAEGRNYLDYVDAVNYSGYGNMTTRRTNGQNVANYGNVNELYRTTEFLYPDENGTGTFRNRWDVNHDKNSLLYKTKRLFDERKIKTLISRFGSNADPTSVDLDYTSRKGSTTGGESRGRNLLNKTRSGRYNGYNDPYCRVWTHHHKYDRLYKLIRPFTGGDGSGSTTTDLETMHDYLKVELPKGEEKNSIFKDGNGKQTKGWKYSVLSQDKDGHYTGFVNIAPKFLGGAEMNIHTKQCMFSIENLAWRGYNPYEFEKALSWEQRGPLGGRIMWFPPYGISFSETTNARWSNNTFIGRGEDVYTYVNTQRTGNLSFLMVIDHPSVLDYATWHDQQTIQWGGDAGSYGANSLTDEDILRFFAGCDSADPGDPDSLFSQAKQTPLTDEYTESFEPTDDTATPDLQTPPKEPVQPAADDTPNGPDKIECYLYFPNNYSGIYDYMFDTESEKGADWQKTKNMLVLNDKNGTPMEYILSGKGCYRHEIENGVNKYGYEMANTKGITVTKPDLKGTNEDCIKTIRKWIQNGDCKNARTINNYIWGYRIDFRKDKNGNCLCSPPMDGLDTTREKRNHNLKEDSYYDLTSSGLNIKPGGEEDAAKNKEGVYSAAVVYAAVNNDKDYITFPNTKEYLGRVEQDKKTTYDSPTAFDDLRNLFKTRKIKKIRTEGCASQDGRKVAKGTANTQLAKDRTWAFSKLLNDLYYQYGGEELCGEEDALPEKLENRKALEDWLNDRDDTHKVMYQERGEPTGESSPQSKKDRYAKLIIEFETEGSSSAVTQGNEAKVTPKQNDDGSVSQPTVSEKTETGKENENETKANTKEIQELLRELQVRYEKLLRYRNRFKAVYPYEDTMHYQDTLDKNGTEYIGLGMFLFMGVNSSMYVETMNYRCGYRKLYYKKIKQFDNQLFLVGYYDYDEKNRSFNGGIRRKIDDDDVLNNEPHFDWLDRGDNCFPIYMVPNKIDFTKCKKDSEQRDKDGVFRLEDCYDYYGKIKDIDIDADEPCGCEGNTVMEKYTPAKVEDLILMKDYNSGEYVNEKIFENYYDTLVKGKFTQEFRKNQSLQYPQYVDKAENKGDKIIDVAEEAKDIAEKLFKNIKKGEKIGEEQAEAEETKEQEKDNLQAEKDRLSEELKTVLLQFDKECLNNTYKNRTDLTKQEFADLVEKIENSNSQKEECVELQQKYKKITGEMGEIAKKLSQMESEESKDTNPTENNGQVVNTDWEQDKTSKYVGYNPVRIGSEEGDTSIYKDPNGNYWVEVEDGRLQRLEKKIKTRFATNRKSLPPGVEEGEADSNHFRYDQEYYFFRQLEKHDPIVFERLMKKLQYFDPAFHSMTPEGFNARLTFLNQCTRQGNTITMSDKYGKTANNLAFGRPPFCVLRLGDFYNQMIVINSINFDYSVSDGILWDLNPEGAGVQPLLCRVSMNFNFIGGSDMAGPVRRLQNAMSFNYYANARLYDNRADRVMYKSERDAMIEGAVDNWELESSDKQYAYSTSMYNEQDELLKAAKKAKEVWVESNKNGNDYKQLTDESNEASQKLPDGVFEA